MCCDLDRGHGSWPWDNKETNRYHTSVGMTSGWPHDRHCPRFSSQMVSPYHSRCACSNRCLQSQPAQVELALYIYIKEHSGITHLRQGSAPPILLMSSGWNHLNFNGRLFVHFSDRSSTHNRLFYSTVGQYIMKHFRDEIIFHSGKNNGISDI